MGFGTILLLFLCVAFGLMIMSPLGNNNTAYSKLANSTAVMKGLQTNSSSGGTTVGTFNLLNTIQISKGLADYISSLTGLVWDIFGSLGDLPDIVKTFIITISLLFLTIAGLSMWLGRSGDL